MRCHAPGARACCGTGSQRLSLPPLPAQGVARIESDLLTAAADDDASFAWHGVVVRRWRDLLHAGPQREPLSRAWEAQWDGRSPLGLPGGGQLQLEGSDGFDRPVRVHARQGGERIVLPGRSHSHALKHVLQDLGVPPWVREQLPLLSDADGVLLAAGDLVHSAAFDAWLRTRGSRLAWSIRVGAPLGRDAASPKLRRAQGALLQRRGLS